MNTPLKYIALLAVLISLSLVARSQSLSLLSGYGADLNNPGKYFNFIPVKLQWHPFRKKTVSFFFGYDFGFTKHFMGDAFTLGPLLPPHISVPEKMKTNIITFGLSLNFRLLSIKPKNDIVLSVMPICVGFQHFKPSYNIFDSKHYLILNQDTDIKPSGFLAGIGLSYRFNKNKTVSINVHSPLATKKKEDFKYRYSAPLRLMFGYVLSYKKDEIKK